MYGTGLANSAAALEKDVVKTTAGDLGISFIGHGSLMLEFGGKIIYAAPYSKQADYAKFPKADLVLITHEHKDHLDPTVLQQMTTAKTMVVLTARCAEMVAGGSIMNNGDTRTVAGIAIEAVPAYNLMHMRDNGQPFIPMALVMAMC